MTEVVGYILLSLVGIVLIVFLIAGIWDLIQHLKCYCPSQQIKDMKERRNILCRMGRQVHVHYATISLEDLSVDDPTFPAKFYRGVEEVAKYMHMSCDELIGQIEFELREKKQREQEKIDEQKRLEKEFRLSFDRYKS